jgi:hypothetical protein
MELLRSSPHVLQVEWTLKPRQQIPLQGKVDIYFSSGSIIVNK